MRYRALLIDPKADHETRAVQEFSSSLKIVEDWATAILGKLDDPDKSVVIYETIEKPVRVLRFNGSALSVETKTT